MQELKNDLSGRKSIELFSIEYKSVKSTNKLIGDLNIHYMDSLSIYDMTSDKLSVIVTRNLKFDPESLFRLSISYLIHHYVKDEFRKELDWESYDLDNEIAGNYAYFAGVGMEAVSLLIGQITSSFGRVPIITNPLFKSKP